MVGKQEVTSSNLSNTGAHSLEPSSQPTDTEEQWANQPFSRNGYKNGYSNEKEGQPFRAGLLISLLL
jgi:hypothetical protein